MNSEYAPILMSIMILILVGGIIPYAVKPFIEDDVNEDSSVLFLVDVVQNGVYVPILSDIFGSGSHSIWGKISNLIKLRFGLGFNANDDNGDIWRFNILDVGPQSFKDYLVSNVRAFTYIPDALSIPLLLVAFSGLIYGTLKLIRG